MSAAPFEIPPDAGPGGSRGWHDVISRSADVAFARRSPRLRAEVLWRLDGVYRTARRVIDAFVSPGDVVLDLGAHWGLFAHRLAEAVAPGGRVIAFEPNPVPLESLRAVAARRGNVDVHPIALSDTPGAVDLHIPLLRHRPLRLPDRPVHPMATVGVPAHRNGRAHEVVRVEARRLDDVVGDADGPITFVKCDVEGHELAVLRGADRLLRRWTPVILIEVEQRHQETPMTAVFGLLRERGYEGYALHGGLRPVAEFDVWRDQVRHLKPHALFSAADAGYLHDFLFVPAGTPRDVVERAVG